MISTPWSWYYALNESTLSAVSWSLDNFHNILLIDLWKSDAAGDRVWMEVTFSGTLTADKIFINLHLISDFFIQVIPRGNKQFRERWDDWFGRIINNSLLIPNFLTWLISMANDSIAWCCSVWNGLWRDYSDGSLGRIIIKPLLIPDFPSKSLWPFIYLSREFDDNNWMWLLKLAPLEHLRIWFLPRKVRNRLIHALNGNSMDKIKGRKKVKQFATSSFHVGDRCTITKALSKLC